MKSENFRSHGMAREAKNLKFQKKWKKISKIISKIYFLYPTFNFRNNEIGAVIGLNQLKRLNKNNSLRTRNLKLF